MPFPIRWKLTLGLLALTLVFLGAYTWLATEVFEADKLSSVFDSQQTQVDAIASELNRSIAKGVFEVSAVGYLALSGATDGARDQFNASDDLIAIEARLEKYPETPLFRFEKTVGVLNVVPAAAAGEKNRQPVLRALNDNLFGTSLRMADPRQEGVILKGVFRADTGMRDPRPGQILFLSEGVVPLAQAGRSEMQERLLKSLIEKTGSGASITRIEPLEGRDYLVSESSLVRDRFKAWALTPKSDALGALGEFRRRSTLFFVFTFFAALLSSFMLSWALTRGLRRLERTAEMIGEGDFSEKPEMNRHDEIGTLGRSVGRMMDRLQAMITSTDRRAREETESQALGYVQKLFPAQRDWSGGLLRLTGLHVPSGTGGDWWYFFQRGGRIHVVIAEVTGRGMPAALAIAAARAVYTQARKEDLALNLIAERLDAAIRDCSNGVLGMRLLMLEIDSERGFGSGLNAGHDDVVILTPGETGFSARYQNLPAGPALGGGQGLWAEQPFHLEAGERLILQNHASDPEENPDLHLLRLESMEKIIADAKTPTEICASLHRSADKGGDFTAIVIENVRRRN